MKILMVLTSHDQLGNTGRKTGFWLEEFAPSLEFGFLADRSSHRPVAGRLSKRQASTAQRHPENTHCAG
jgi:hypothetical protein